MPQSGTTVKRSRLGPRNKVESRYTVGLAPELADQVQRCAETVDASMSKAIAALVRLGLENQENRRREFFRRLKGNLASDDPCQQDRLVDEFRTLILGRAKERQISEEDLFQLAEWKAQKHLSNGWPSRAGQAVVTHGRPQHAAPRGCIRS